MSATSTDLMRVGSASIAGGAATVAVSLVSSVLSAIVFLALVGWALVLFLPGFVQWVQNLDPRPPATPVLVKAQLRGVPKEPPALIPELARNCVICGRPLTNAESIRARVGSTCIKTYGPRYKMMPNPDHARWRAVLAAAQADQAAEQARLNAAHQQALANHAQLMRAWEAERRSPDATQRRTSRREAGRQLLLGGVVVPVGGFTGMAVVLPFL